jgi:tetratricopeptide (TPR) repeat protein
MARERLVTVIRLTGLGDGADGALRIRVSFDSEAEYDVLVTDPATDADEQNLAWYFEEHLRYPFLDTDREQQAVRQLAAYGEALFRQVFSGDASYDYRSLRERSFDGCRLEVSGPSALHRLHWEALRDPGLDRPLALRMPITRRVAAQPSRFALPGSRPTLNVLVVVARPGGRHDIGYRTISRPLLDALRTAQLPVTVDLVRPGTWEALRARLRSATERHGSGSYHVVHFDLHGTFTEHSALQQEGLEFPAGPPEPFTGKRGFLFFETQRDGVAGVVPARTVASLLAEHRVPVAALNACQSAMQSVWEAGLAQHLAEAGVPVTVGMAYSVTVSAAVLAMPVLYKQLADGTDPVLAVHTARQALHENRGRQAYFDQQIDLEDWLLPVVFGQRPLQVRLRDMTEAEEAEFYQRLAEVGDEPTTEYGFVGRDLDIQAIERRLLASPNRNELLIQGMAGAGKSTLLRHLAWWWQRTGLIGQVFRFSYEDRAWTAGHIVREIRARLFSPAEHARADTRLSEAAQLEQLAQRLRSERHLMILDNAESITAARAAIPHALSRAEQDKLGTLLTRLQGGRTLVLLGSRETEAWLTSANTGPSVYPLPGLDPQAASQLLERILGRHNATRWLDDDTERGALEDLVNLLGGYPLPLTVVLPTLASSPPSAVLRDLREGGPSADPAGIIQQAIEYSHGKLDPALQNSLLLLAPFTSVINSGPILARYQELLLEGQAVRDLGPIDLSAALDQAVSVGLASPHPQLGHMVEVQPVLPYFLRSSLQDRPGLRAATDQAHYRLYYPLAANLADVITSSQDPEQRALGLAIAKAEYANLRDALSHALRTAQPVSAVMTALYQYLGQAQQHDTRRHLLESSIAAYTRPETSEQHDELANLHHLTGNAAIAQHRLEDAKDHYEAALAIWQANNDRRAQARIYYQLGQVARGQRQFAEAEDNYRQALTINLELGDQLSAAETYHELGFLAKEQRQYAEAEDNYRQALTIKLELGDRLGAAMTYHNLGIVAQEQRRYAEADDNYRKALASFLEFRDWPNAARSYHQLGIVAHLERRYADAQTNLRHALDIRLTIGDQYGAAETYAQLGQVAREHRRYEEAKANFNKAIGIFLEFRDSYKAAKIYHDLGVVAHLQRRFAEAEANYRKALDIFLEFGDQHSVALCHHNLGLIAQEQRTVERHNGGVSFQDRDEP